MIKRKILQTNQPVITSYPKYAHLFSMVSLTEDILPWVAKNLLLFHTYTYKTHQSVDLGGFSKESLDDDPYPHAPFLTRYIIPFFSINSDVVDSIIEYINKDYYVCVNVNTAKIRIYPYSLEHPVLIVGYNLEKNELYVNDFFPPSSVYRTIPISMSDIRNAIKNSKYQFFNIYQFNNKKWDYSKHFSIFKNIVIENIEKIINNDYIPVNPYYFKTEYQVGYKSGLEVYDEIETNLEKYGRKGLHVLYESKKLMLYCLNYLFQKNVITWNALNDYRRIVEKSYVIRNLYLKWLLTRESEMFENVKAKVKEIKNEEKEALESILTCLKNSNL